MGTKARYDLVPCGTVVNQTSEPPMKLPHWDGQTERCLTTQARTGELQQNVFKPQTASIGHFLKRVGGSVDTEKLNHTSAHH